MQNNLMVGAAKACTDATGWLLAAVRDPAGNIRLCAQRTPGFGMLIYEDIKNPSQEAVDQLANDIHLQGIKVPSVMAERSLAKRFTRALCASNQQTYTLHETFNYMMLQKDDFWTIPKVPGLLRPMTDADMHYAPYWAMAFNLECGLNSSTNVSDYVEKLSGNIARGTSFVWQDAQPVSQAYATRDVGDSISIGNVYTPPQFRGRHYATACVAALSRLMFERGKKFCVLYADAANPASNAIYMSIGYHQIATIDHLYINAR